MNTVNVDLKLGGGRLIQIANRTLTQMMSYIIDTPDGGVIVIDGGHLCAEDARALYSYLEQRGKKVDAWFITHAHGDHFGAFVYLVENGMLDVKVDKLYFNFPPIETLTAIEGEGWTGRFLDAVATSGIEVVTPEADDIFEIKGVKIEIISVPKNAETYAKSINATSIIFRVYFPLRDVLFMGDYDVHAQEDYLRRYDPAKLKGDIVQMPHHGQNGIDRSFYELIRPRICLYTAPKWLWENNLYMCEDPATVGKGPFTIFETRQWMDELEAEASYTLADGDCIFE